MLKIISVSLRNFLSYGNNLTTVFFEKPGTTLIVGEDLDNTTNGTGANGVGKSTIIEALTYGLYDKTISSISKDNLINNINEKNMEVIVEFETEDHVKYRVHRTRKTKAGNNVFLSKDDQDITLDSAVNTNTYIENIVGIPYDLWVRIVVFSAAHQPFLDLPSKQQTDIIEELFGLTMLSKKAEHLKQLIKETERQIEIHKVKISSAEGEQQRLQQQIANAKTRVDTWDKQTIATITELRSKLDKISNVDINQQELLHKQLQEYQHKLSNMTKDLRSTERVTREVLATYKKNEDEIKHLKDAKCPRCLQQYSDAEAEIGRVQAASEELFAELEQLNREIADMQETISKLQEQKQDLQKQILVEDIDELLKVKDQADVFKRKIDELSNSINPHNESLDELKQIKLEPINYDAINKLTNVLDHQKFLLKLLTKKDSFIRKDLLKKKIPYLNSRLQEYLSKLGLPHKVEFSKEMTAVISQFGRELSFGNLSRGQAARVNLALAFAFKDVRQKDHKKVNICLLDEVLDHGLDTVGVQAAAKLVKQIAREDGTSLYIISHRDEIDSTFDNKLTVQMSKGFSYIVESTKE